MAGSLRGWNCVALTGWADFTADVPVASNQAPVEKQLVLSGSGQEMFHEEARVVARGAFGGEVFVRAVVEVSNFCRENCSYCGMRRSNRELERYRARHEELAELLIHHRPASVTDVNIQAGEDPIAVREVVIPLIRTLSRETGLGISVCLGTLPEDAYEDLRSAGASIYIMKFELGNAAQYQEFEAPGTLEERLGHIRHLASTGWKVSSGFIAGLPGQSLGNLAENISVASGLPIHGCSASPFIPGGETPLAGSVASDANLTLNAIASMRLMRPDWVIPAVSALNLAAEDGYRRGLRAGANLATINLTPEPFRENYVIYKRDRFIMTEERVLGAIDAEGLTPSREGLAAFYRRTEQKMASAVGSRG